MNRYTILRVAVAVLAAATFTGCSLLKVSVSTGDPLPKEDVQARLLTRGFYYDMASEVARTADSIVSTSPDLSTRVAAMRWKIRATRAGVAAAMQGSPEVAMADMWILCHRMNAAFAAAPDSLLFGPQSDLARAATARLDNRAQRIARQTLSSARYELMSRFVAAYVRANPAFEAQPVNTTLAWTEFLRENGIEHSYVTGSIAEVLSDVNDRLSGQTQQLSNSIGWSKDILEMQFQQDSMGTRLTAQLDSLERNFERMVVVAENMPAISSQIMGDLNQQLTQLISTLDASATTAFINLDRQRDELQSYVSQERQALVEQLRLSADELTTQVLDAVPGLIGKVLLYLVLALVVLLGLPFAAGYWLGAYRQKSRQERK